MNLKEYYWFFENVIPPKMCDDIIKIGEETTLLKAVTGHDPKEAEKTDFEKQRNSNIAWLSEKWIYDEINPYIHSANSNSGWNFQWDWNEPCQFTKYTESQFYDWHCDSYVDPIDNTNDPNIHGKFRKLSMTLLLNDGNDFEGGDFQFDFRNYNTNLVKEEDRIITVDKARSKGSIIVFPSFVWHRVTKVTKGTRYSLVNWSLGDRFI